MNITGLINPSAFKQSNLASHTYLQCYSKNIPLDHCNLERLSIGGEHIDLPSPKIACAKA